MATGIEPALARIAGQVMKEVAGRLGEEGRLRKLRDSARPLMAREVAKGLLAELDAREAKALADYLTSPDFEQVALQIAIARMHKRAGQRDELVSAARAQIRQGLRLAVALPDDRMLGITDVVLDALLAAPHKPGDVTQSAAIGHLTAMAARNGELLDGLKGLAASREQARLLRAQVAAMHAELRMPHTGVSRSVPWKELYVEPEMHDLFFRSTPPARELLQAGQRMVVLGDPGAGKSTLAAKLAHDIAADPDGTEVPFLVVLRQFAAALQAGERTLAEHLAVVARDPHNVVMSAETVDYLLLNGRAVVILDGLDELTDVSLRRRLTDLVRGFAILHPLVPILVTSRSVGYREAPLDDALFPTFALAPFTAEQIEAYARNWFMLDDGTPLADRERLAESFLRESLSIEDLRSNPLLLTLLCTMYSADHYIPRLRAQIYERCALMVFERWDSMRGVPRPAEFDGRVRGAVQSLAWEMLTGSESEMPRHKIVRVLAAHLVRRGFHEDDAAGAADKFLDYCAGRAWILTEVGSDDFEPIYGFAHRTFMEYFAAEYLVRHHPTAEAVWGVISPRVLAGEWEVIAQLALQLLDRNFVDGAEGLLRMALRDADDTSARALADFCAAALGHVCVSPTVAEDVVRVAWASVSGLAEEDRFKIVMSDDDIVELSGADGPLYQLLYHSLEGNRAYVERGLSDLLSSRLADGDALSFLVLGQFGRCYTHDDGETRLHWAQFALELQAQHADRYLEWRVGSPWALLLDDDMTTMDIENRGVLPLYVSGVVMVGATYPRALDWFRHGVSTNAGLLCDRLMRLPTPWMSYVQWRDAFRPSETRSSIFTELTRMTAPEHGDDLGSFLVTVLPYLEMALFSYRRAVDFAAGGLLLELVGNRNQVKVGKSLAAAGISPDVCDFLLSWRAGKFRVLG